MVTAFNPTVAVKLLNNRVAAQELYWQYFNGLQPLTYTTKKYRDAFARMIAAYTENMCPAVIDPIVDRLKIVNFEIDGSDNNDSSTALWKIWKASRMESDANNVHEDALVVGNAYVTVWPNDKKEVRIVPQSSDEFAVHYDVNSGVIDWAVKNWQQDDGYVRLTLYYPDRIERYTSLTIPKDRDWEKLTYVPLGSGALVRNPYGVVPAFHLSNKSPRGKYGISELKDVIPIQDALNKSVADLLVGMEFSAFAQRWATGLELDTEEDTSPPFKPGIDRIWATANEQAKFGEFSAADLSKIIETHDMFTLTLARVSGTPLHYMQLNSSVFPSGEGLKTAERRFNSKIDDRQTRFGSTWEDVLTFTAQVANINLTDKVDVKWANPDAPTSRELAEVGGLKKVFGVSNKQIQREMGYSEAQISQMEKENLEATPIETTVPENTNNNVVDTQANQKLIS